MIASSVSLLASLGIGHGKRKVAAAAADESPATLTAAAEHDFVEIGVVISKHGVRGEMLVRSSTDFPKARFENPGLRWLKVPEKGKGKHRLECVELLSGRNRPGKLPCWLVKFKDVTTAEQAAELIGSQILVKSDDRPELEEGDFYTPDLIGMEVVLQSTGETIGIVDDMFNFGAQDVLRVKRTGAGPMIWIPFVKPIVPEVLLESRKMIVNPPEGLLELNVRKEKPTSDVRKEDLKARRKLQERVSGLKKSLAKCKQDHLVERIITKDESTKEDRDALLLELLKVDFKALLDSFHQAVESSTRKKYECLLSGFPEVPQKQTVAWKELEDLGNVKEPEIASWWKQGIRLISENSVAVVSFTRSPERLDSTALQAQAKRLQLMQDAANNEFPDAQGKCQVPWFLVTTSTSRESLTSMLEDNSFFGLDKTQVCLLEQEALPVFEREGTELEHRILMQSPWKMAQSPTGDGGVLKLLSSENLVNDFSESGIEYLQVYDADNENARAADAVLFGFAHEQKSELSIQVTPAKLGKDVVGFMKNADGYDFVRLSGDPSPDKLKSLHSAATPSGTYVLSVAFLKRLQDNGLELDLRARTWHQNEAGINLEYSLLDCLEQCKPRKVSLLSVHVESVVDG